MRSTAYKARYKGRSVTGRAAYPEIARSSYERFADKPGQEVDGPALLSLPLASLSLSSESCFPSKVDSWHSFAERIDGTHARASRPVVDDVLTRFGRLSSSRRCARRTVRSGWRRQQEGERAGQGEGERRRTVRSDGAHARRAQKNGAYTQVGRLSRY